MSPLRKRILIGLGLFAAVGLFSFLIYWQFFLVAVPDGANTNQSLFGRVLPDIANTLRRSLNTNRQVTNSPLDNLNVSLPTPATIANGGPTLAPSLVDAGGLNPTLGTNGRDLQYYDQVTGKFWRVGPDGQLRVLLTDQAFPGVEFVTWSSDGSKAVMGFPDDSKIVYDFTRKQQYTLPKEAQQIEFSPDGNQVVYKYVGEQGTDRWLAVSGADGSQAQVVENLGDKAPQATPAWSPNNQVVATFEQASGASRSQVVFIGLQGENFPAANVAGRGFTPKWSPTGNSILYTVYNGESLNNPKLYVMDGRPDSLGQRQVDLGVQTFVDKCAFAQTGLVYCAVPRFLPSGSGQIRSLANSARDDFYEIDVSTGSRRRIAQPTDTTGTQSYNAADVSVSADGSILYFRDIITNSLRQVRLK